MSLPNASPMRLAEPNTQHCIAKFNGGGAAANWSKLDGDGISSVTYNAATGKFKINFTDVGVSILSAAGVGHRATGSAPLHVGFVPGTLSIANKTVDIEVWDMATPSLVDPATTVEIHLDICWKKTT